MDLTSLELWLLQKAISTATSPAAKAFVLTELKGLESHVTNQYLKAAVVALEAVVAAELQPAA